MGKLERCAKHASLHLPQAALRCACPGPAGPPPYGGSKPQASPSSPTPRKSWREAVSVPRSPFTSIGIVSVKSTLQLKSRWSSLWPRAPVWGRARRAGGTAMGGGWDSIKIKNRAASGKKSPRCLPAKGTVNGPEPLRGSGGDRVRWTKQGAAAGCGAEALLAAETAEAEQGQPSKYASGLRPAPYIWATATRSSAPIFTRAHRRPPRKLAKRKRKAAGWGEMPAAAGGAAADGKRKAPPACTDGAFPVAR